MIETLMNLYHLTTVFLNFKLSRSFDFYQKSEMPNHVEPLMGATFYTLSWTSIDYENQVLIKEI